MKAFLWLGVMGVMTNGAFAQAARPLMQGNMVRGDVNRAPHSAPIGPRFSAQPRPFRPFGGLIFPLGFGGYGYGGYDYGYVPQPQNVVVVAPPPPAYLPVPERPPDTATMVIHEYQPTSAVAPQASDGDQPMFAVVLKNGTMLSASAVVVQNGALHIVDADGAHQRVPLDAVDRETTKRVNRERKLQLQLPPER